MLRSLKSALRAKLIACEGCYRRYQRLKYDLGRLWVLRYFLRDTRHTAAYMRWRVNLHLSKEQLQAKLLFYYHKVEKGLSMPGKKRLFGVEVVPQVISMLEVWEQRQWDLDDPIYKGAIESLRAYAMNLQAHQLDPTGVALPEVLAFLAQRVGRGSMPDTPLHPQRVVADLPVSRSNFSRLLQQRRSYRDFSDRKVPPEALKSAVELAQLSPSACNRQPCRVHVIEGDDMRRAALAEQNGNAGFGHKAPLVLAITADASYFFDATERHQPYIDGGLFTMSLIYALQVQGLVTCCLNWCVHPKQDTRLRQIVPMRPSELVVMLIAVGYPPEDCAVPKSHRKSLQDVLVWHAPGESRGT